MQDIETLAARLESLEAKEEIRQVIGRLCRAQDRMDIEAIAACYHPDGYDDHLTFKGSGRAFAEWFVGVTAPSFEEVMHFTGPSVVDVEGDVAQASTQCVAHHLSRAGEATGNPLTRLYRAECIMGLRYLDRFERRAGRWLIAHRRCVFDWMYNNPFEGSIHMLEGENIIWGRRDQADLGYAPVGPSPIAAAPA